MQHLPRGAKSFGCKGIRKSLPVVAALGCRLCMAGTLKKSAENILKRIKETQRGIDKDTN